jgi:hypothetical protein
MGDEVFYEIFIVLIRGQAVNLLLRKSRKPSKRNNAAYPTEVHAIWGNFGWSLEDDGKI